jgi:hypothetical protein
MIQSVLNTLGFSPAARIHLDKEKKAEVIAPGRSLNVLKTS